MQYSFNPTIATPLCEIMGRNKSDKGHVNILSSWHNYTTVYYVLFKDIRYEKLRVFELGLGTNNVDVPSNMGVNGRPGASLYGWAEFFPNAEVYGADIDSRVLFNTDRIKTFYCDQTKPDVIKSMWDHKELDDLFDIIIEDGLHEFNANVCFFENSIHKLKKQGFYIIEDIANSDIPLFVKQIELWKDKYPDLFFGLVSVPSKVNSHDNNLLVIRKL